MNTIEHTMARLTELIKLIDAGKPLWEVWAAYAHEAPEHGTCRLCNDYPGCVGCPIFTLFNCNCQSPSSLTQKAKSLLLRTGTAPAAKRFIEIAISALKNRLEDNG